MAYDSSKIMKTAFCGDRKVAFIKDGYKGQPKEKITVEKGNSCTNVYSKNMEKKVVFSEANLAMGKGNSLKVTKGSGTRNNNTGIENLYSSAQPVQSFKDFSLPEHNKYSYDMKISDRNACAALPDLETFGRKLQQARVSKPTALSPPLILKSVYGTNSSETNASTFQQLKRFNQNLKDILTVSDSNFKMEKYSTEQSIPGSKDLSVGNSTYTAYSSGPLNQTECIESSKCQASGYDVSEVHTDTQAYIPMPLEDRQITKGPYIAYPKGSVSSELQKYYDERQHSSYSMQSCGDDIVKHELLHKNNLNKTRTSFDYKGCSQSSHGNSLNTNNRIDAQYNNMTYYSNKTFSSPNKSSAASPLRFTQQRRYLDENISMNCTQKAGFGNTQHSVKQPLSELNQTNSLNISQDNVYAKESFYMKRETIHFSTIKRYNHNDHFVRPSYTRGMDCSRDDNSVSQYQSDLFKGINEINNVFPTFYEMLSKNPECESEVKTNDYYTTMTGSRKNLALDINGNIDMENKTVDQNLFNKQNKLDEISHLGVLESGKTRNKGKRELEVSPVEKMQNYMNLDNDHKNNVSASIDKPENKPDLNGDESEEEVDLNEFTVGFENVDEGPILRKIETAVERNIFKTPENQLSKHANSIIQDSNSTSNNILSNFDKDFKITEQYKYPQVVMSPLKMTKRLEDMINDYIAKRKLDSPILPVFQTPVITSETPITPRNALDSSPPLLSPIGLPTLSERMPFDKENTETCKDVIKKKKKRKSRSKMMNGILPTRQYDREKTLIETAEKFLGKDFSSKIARKRKGTQETNENHVKRSKKANQNIKEVLVENKQSSFGKCSDNTEGEIDLQLNNHVIDKETSRTKSADTVNDNSVDLLSKDFHNEKLARDEICDNTEKRHEEQDINEEEEYWHSIHLKKRKHQKFLARIEKEDVKKRKYCKTKNRSVSGTCNTQKISYQSGLIMKICKNKETTPLSKKRETYEVTKRTDKVPDRQSDEERESDVKCSKTLEMAKQSNKKCIEHKDIKIFKAPNTKVKKSNEEKCATKDSGNKQHKDILEVNSGKDKAITEDQRLIIQSSLKNKSKSKCHKKKKGSDYSIKADLSVSLSTDERDEVKLANNVGKINERERSSDAKDAAEVVKGKSKKKNKKDSALIKDTDGPDKNKKKLKDPTGQSKKGQLKIVLTKDTDPAEVKIKINGCKKRSKLTSKVGSKIMNSPIDKNSSEHDDYKTCAVEVQIDQSKHRDNTDVANNNKESEKKSACHYGLLSANILKTKRTRTKAQNKKISTDPASVVSKELQKSDLPGKTVDEINDESVEMTKKEAFKRRKIVLDHLKKYNKDAGVKKEKHKSKAIKEDLEHGGQVVCRICKKAFATKRLLSGHTVSCHPYRCFWCKMEFDSKKASQVHYFTHMKTTYQCDLCNVKYGNKSTYNQHLKSQRHKRALEYTAENSEQYFDNQTGQMTPEVVVENIENFDDQYTSERTVAQFYSTHYRNSQISLCESGVSNDATEWDYYHTGNHTDITGSCNSKLLPSYDISAFSTNQNANIKSERHDMNEHYISELSKSQDLEHFNGADAVESVAERSSVFVENGKIYATMTNVKMENVRGTDKSSACVQGFRESGDDSLYKEIAGYHGYSEITEEEIMNQDQLADSSLLCRIANSFSLSE